MTTIETISSAEKKQFQKKILDRYAENKRDLPWRKTTDPYKILVSEVMLQQTQVPRVIQKFTRRMELWPTVFDVASAPRMDILREWSWLWFNRRAINLHEACKKIAYDSQSTDYIFLMADYTYLRTLPWVGDYTANAVLAFWYNQEVPVLDINIKRVLLHSFQLPPETSVFDIQTLALSLVPAGRSCDRHNALMDYGSQVLHSKATWIRSAKQSTFAWSDREVRWWILKQLTADKKVTLDLLKIQFPQKDIERIVQWLEKEHIICVKNKVLKIV